jgi:hypothetical protein
MGMKSQPTFHGAAGKVVLHAIAKKNLGAAIIHMDWQTESEDSFGPLAAFPD